MTSDVQRALQPVRSSPGVFVHPIADRRLAVEQWLLAAHREPAEARQEWDRDGLTMLTLGALFSAVRIPQSLVLAGAGLERTNEVLLTTMLDEFLADVLDSGPVICDAGRELYYALVPASTPERWHQAAADWQQLGVEILGRTWQVGVPALTWTRDENGRSSYWSVPMQSAGELCDPLDVARLISACAHRAAKGTSA